MRYIYINQRGVLGDYAKPLKRQSKTGFKRVQNLQIALEQTIRLYSNLPATEQNSKNLWKSLLAVAKKAIGEMTATEIGCDAYLEIERWVGTIGQQIAFGAKRGGVNELVGYGYMRKFREMESGNPDFINAYLQMLTCMTSTGFASADNAEALFAKIDRMDNEELFDEALKNQEKMRYSKTEKQLSSGGYSLNNDIEEIPF